jgi:hypothetical protein
MALSKLEHIGESDEEFELGMLQYAIADPPAYDVMKKVFEGHPHPSQLRGVGLRVYKYFQKFKQGHEDG